LNWLMQQEGAGGKVLVYAHRYHLSTAPVRAGWWIPHGLEDHSQVVTGIYLRHDFGSRLVSIGNLIGQGTANCTEFSCCSGPSHSIPPATAPSMDSLAGELNTPRFLLDLRKAPVSVANWLGHEHEIGQGGDILKVPVGRAFDVLYYLDAVTPACDAAPHPT
jgi:erythromycin esterase-like protein